MLRAEVAEKEGNQYPRALLFAATAIGFDGVGREREQEPSLVEKVAGLFGLLRKSESHPRLIDPHAHPKEYQKVHEWIEQRSNYLPYWRYVHPENSGVLAVAMHPLGRSVVASFQDGSVRSWDFQSGKSKSLREPGNRKTNLLRFGTSRKLDDANGFAGVEGIIVGAVGNEITYWEGVEMTSNVSQYDFNGEICGLIYREAQMRDSHHYASVAVSGKNWDHIKLLESDNLWESRKNRFFRSREQKIGELHPGSQTSSLAINLHEVIAIGDTSGAIGLIDGRNQPSALPHIEGHGGEITSLEFSPNGNLLLSASSDNTVALWNVETGTKLISRNQTTFPTVVAFAPHGDHLAIGLKKRDSARGDGKFAESSTLEGNIQIWRVEEFANGAKRNHMEATLIGDGKSVSTLAFDGTGTTLASGSENGTVLLWNLNAEQTNKSRLFNYVKNNWYTIDKDAQTVSWNSGHSPAAGFFEGGRNTITLPSIWSRTDEIESAPEDVLRQIVTTGNWSLLAELSERIVLTGESKYIEDEHPRLQAIGAIVGDRIYAPEIKTDSWAQWTLQQRLRDYNYISGERPSVSDPANFRNQIGMSLIWCESGTFPMGSRYWEQGRESNESLHLSDVKSGFWISAHEVTQGQWKAILKDEPSSFKRAGAGAPVESVTLSEALRFCEKLTSLEREKETLPANWIYSLPTEEEWEYACRAGTYATFSFGEALNGLQANCDGRYPYGEIKPGPYAGRPLPVGSFPPNLWNIHDMHGNVWEFCLGRPGKPSMLRGGGWSNLAEGCRAAKRIEGRRDLRGDDIGFRVVLVRTYLRPMSIHPRLKESQAVN